MAQQNKRDTLLGGIEAGATGTPTPALRLSGSNHSLALSAAEGPLATGYCKKGVKPRHLFSCVSYRKQTIGAQKGCQIFRNPIRVGTRGERSRTIPPGGLVILSGVTGQSLPSRSCGTSGHAVEEPLFDSHNRLRSRREAQCGSAWLGAGDASMSGVMSSVRRTQ